ncbi:mercury(II) reductase [Stackebrandtia nassauensis]|uniref:Mercuric reductase n=1 Tax=Stackebrandtia nassauensis (strain DSM 44728 / CIP 108903 / NRRL B-16338 / NBRC 102104 / LLR-40K-21) TaxID=446470 RepID=D3PUY0_STANL|nr:mercury(II) reductase [Stackebrandtia nassauensis]ADD45004.1 mercuric reductase [Stackebrandtia nassauensis DSM 44728]
MTDYRTHDLAIIGSGGGAFAAAIAARKQGLSVVMVEAGAVGGTCVNTGCVPSKALLAAAEARHQAQGSRFAGAPTRAGAVSWRELRASKDDLVAAMRADKYTGLAAEYGWEIVAETAAFAGTPDAPAIEVTLHDGGGRRLQASHYVIATGSIPWVPPIPGLAEAGYLTSTTAMDLEELPESLIVIGGNAIGLEQAQLFARLGVKVTIVEALDRLAPFEEPDISSVVEHALADEEVDVVTAAVVTKVHTRPGGYAVEVIGPDGAVRQLAGERLLVATGRRPNTAGLRLASVGVEVGDRDEVIVDDRLRTANPRIWAAGDVTGHPQFVYVAGRHGSVIVDNAFNEANRTVDHSHLPRVTFTSPTVASVGLTDAQAVAAGYTCECRVLPLEYVPRAVVDRDTIGVVKLVADANTGRLLGAHIAAKAAGDMILAATYALDHGMTVADMADAWCPYLTWAEALKLTAQTFTTDVTKLSCCAA